MCGQFGFEVTDLTIQFGDDADCGAGGRGECGGDRGGCGELLGAQRCGDLLSPSIEVALSPSAFECRSDLGQAQTSCLDRSGSATQDGQGIAVVQVVEGLQRGWVVLAQCRTQCVGVPGAGPDQVLVSSGEAIAAYRGRVSLSV